MQRAINAAVTLFTCAVFFQHGAPIIEQIRPQDSLQLFDVPVSGRLGADLCGLLQRETRTLNIRVFWHWKF